MKGAVERRKQSFSTASSHTHLYHAMSALCASLQSPQAHARAAPLCYRRSSQHTRSTRWVSSPSPSRPPCSTWPLQVIILREDAHPASCLRRVRANCSQDTQRSGACNSGTGIKKRRGRGEADVCRQRCAAATSVVALLHVSRLRAPCWLKVSAYTVLIYGMHANSLL